MSERILSQIKIDRRSPIPIYQQLQEQFEALIMDEAWEDDEPLPSETILASELHISTMTVRQAMTRLVNKGLIYREQGRGTFVTPQPFEHPLQRLESFTEDMHARNLKPGAQILDFSTVPASEAVASLLSIEPNTPVLHLKRLRLAEDHPVALHDAYLICTNLTRDALETAGSLYASLETIGHSLVEAKETLEATAADDETARLLELPTGEPLLKATRVSWDQNHAPVEAVYAYYRANFYRYTVWLRR
ncbi:MAG TPA: GntR family transcriptional regulator [Aggregatilinea sp.]|uniref:GntR family transcriptional regulator n=1 Tax=Aggregatilinea sp. TaxID=2806333 RepID=UPI002CBD6908|nr:GntR family transcriptional regulator [Aggregatilinea sp.]HML20533.1 GntR family transcriptional regulator [Aggregatilinea sp.]